MIFVTLGTQDKSFERLLKEIDKQIRNGKITEQVIVQAGSTKYESDHMQILDLLPTDEFYDLIKKADFIITHGGVGSILQGLQNNKKIIACARRKKYKEHTNDHQIEIIEKLSNEGYILELKNVSELGKVLDKVKTFKPKKYKSNTDKFTKIVDEYITKENHTSWYNKYRELISYLFFGGCTTLVNIISFLLLDKIGMNLYVNNVISWVLAVLFAYVTNKLFVFESKSTKKNILLKELSSFLLFRIVSLGIDMLSMYVMVTVFAWSKLLAKIIANIIVIVVNYVFSKIFIFKKDRQALEN